MFFQRFGLHSSCRACAGCNRIDCRKKNQPVIATPSEVWGVPLGPKVFGSRSGGVGWGVRRACADHARVCLIMRGIMRGDAWGRPGPLLAPRAATFLSASASERRSSRGWTMRGLCAPAFLLCAGLCAGLCARVFDHARGDARGRPGPLRAPAPPEAATSAAAPERLGAGAAEFQGLDYARTMRACVFIMRGIMRGTLRAGV